MRQWHVGTCETNDIRMRYLRTGGDGPAVVLLHGLMGSGSCWSPVARALEIIDLQADARLKTSLSAFAVLAPPNPDFRAVVRAIDVPTFLLIGDCPVVSHDLALELGRINPLISVEQIADAGHGLPFDQPERVARAVTSFLDALPA